MKTLFAAALAASLVAGAAFAQTTPAPDATPAAPAATAPAPAATPAPAAPKHAMRHQIRVDLRACQKTAAGQGLKGKARFEAVQDCFAKTHPKVAKARGCRFEGRSQHLRHSKLREFIKSCIAKPTTM
ncbi:MAG: PsiF repeat-containing protein [Hyphomicrobiales bacterium]|nr:PsiF repeat-containing protein [Hyphomicrobiales bacterium]MDE2017529.1 PsiF repeat-containing protein [Hyphomicrobiales bacterium]